MVFNLAIGEDYGYVILTGTLTAITMQYLGGRVIGARDKYKVPLPHLYADMTACQTDKDKELFNCYQRGHQNALESYAQILMFLFVGGLKHPRLASGAGVLWCLGRILYAWGYSTGDPSKRSQGAPLQYPGLLILLGTTVSTALSFLKVI